MKRFLAPKLLSSFGLVLLLFVGACGTTRAYDGPAQGRDQVAVIRPAPLLNGRRAEIARVDDVAIEPLTSDVEVLPGRHILTLWFQVGSTASERAQGDVEFDAKAGHTYEAHSAVSGFLSVEHWFWIADAGDEMVVGGRPPPLSTERSSTDGK